MTLLNFDVLADEEAREPFRFTLAGREWALPHVSELTLRQQKAVDSGQQVEVARLVGMNDALEPDGEALAEALLDAKGSVVGKVLFAWLAHAGHKPGESQG